LAPELHRFEVDRGLEPDAEPIRAGAGRNIRGVRDP